MPSKRLIDSTWITSAPRVASMLAAIGPAHHAVRSTTRTPASGSAAGVDGGDGRDGDPQLGRPLDDLGGGVVRRPGVDDAVPFVAPRLALHRAPELLLGQQ